MESHFIHKFSTAVLSYENEEQKVNEKWDEGPLDDCWLVDIPHHLYEYSELLLDEEFWSCVVGQVEQKISSVVFFEDPIEINRLNSNSGLGILVIFVQT